MKLIGLMGQIQYRDPMRRIFENHDVQIYSELEITGHTADTIRDFGFWVSLALGWFVNPYWFLFTAFVGLNLLQSAFTRWCLMEDILRKTLFRGSAGSASSE